MSAADTMRASVFAVLGSRERPGGAICRDLDALVPAFRARVEGVVAAMTADGHDPWVFETLRSPERCAELFRRGTGSLMSMHRYGIAADIISRKDHWRAPRAFWSSLRTHAEAHGLTSGAAWRRVDLPHVQAVPVSEQTLIRAALPYEIANIVERRLPLVGVA